MLTVSYPVFKEGFHKADLEPGAQENYLKQKIIVKDMEAYNSRIDSQLLFCYQLLFWLNDHPKIHRRAIKDMCHALAMMSLYFLKKPTLLFDRTRTQSLHAIKQIDRMKGPLPDRRTYHSNKCRPKEFWDEWDKLPGQSIIETYPSSWDKVVRPIIAHCKSF